MIKSSRFSSSTAALLGGFALLASSATLRSQITNVPINNFSFETPSVRDGSTAVGLTNWLVVGNLLSGLGTPLNETVLTSNPTNAQYVGTTGNASIAGMDGIQIASFRTGLLTLSGSATQVTGQLLAVNVPYTLTVGVGNPLDSVFQGYTVSLLAGGTILSSVSNVNIPDGTFRDVSVNYLLDPLDPNLPALVNSALTVVLSVPGVPLGSLITNYGTDFDNVRLTAGTAVPEPSTYAFVGMGLLGLVGLQTAKRRRRIFVKA